MAREVKILFCFFCLFLATLDIAGRRKAAWSLALSRNQQRELGTKKLWGAANEPPYFHHGKFTTLREAILAHAGEAQSSTDAFLALSGYEQGSVIEFLKTLQVLPAGTDAPVVDEDGRPRPWPPAWAR